MGQSPPPRQQWKTVDGCLLWLGLMLALAGFYLSRVEYLLSHPAVEPYYDREALRVARGILLAIIVASGILAISSARMRRRAAQPLWISHAASQIWWVAVATAAYGLGPVTTPILGLVLLGGVLSTMVFPRRVALSSMVTGMSILALTIVAERAGVLPYAPLFGAFPIVNGRLSTEYVVAMASIAFFVIFAGFALSSYLVERGRARERALIEASEEREHARAEATERRAAQGVLAKSERRLREQIYELELIYENSPIGLCFLDSDLRFVRINERLATVNGAPVAAHIGKTLWEVVPDIAVEMGPLMQGVLETGTPVINMQVVAKPPGVPEERHWLVSYYPVRPAEGGVLGVVGVVQDVNELRLAEERSHQHLETLAHVSRLATMSQMATGIAHELNQPLAAISNYAAAGQKLVQSGGDAAALSPILDELGTLAQRAGSIVHHLRALVGKKRAKPERIQVSMNTLATDVLTLLDSVLRLNGVALVLQLDEALPRVHVDAIQIQQVVLNLIRNAVDAMAETDASRRQLTVATTDGVDAVEVAICDTGAGISPANRDQIFDEFYSTKNEGMGMGLAISRSIIEDHGGKLWGEANPAGGSTFRFTVPIVDGNGDARA